MNEILIGLSSIMFVLGIGMLALIWLPAYQGRMARATALGGTVSAAGVLVLGAGYRLGSGLAWSLVGSGLIILGSLMVIRSLWANRSGNT